MHSVKTCSTLSNQKSSLLFGENNVNIVFNRFAIIDGFKFGLSKGLYFILLPSSIIIKSSNLSYFFYFFFT